LILKRLMIPSLLALLLCLIIATPVVAAGFGVSPKEINLEVPANGSTEATLYIASYGSSGDIQIGLENIPLRVEPETVRIRRSDTGKKVVLTFYGEESLGEQTFEGKITFLATGGGNIGFGIKVKAVITQTAPVLEETPPSEQALPDEAPAPPVPTTSTPPATTEFPILQLAGIIAGTAIVVTLIVVFARRRRY